MKSNEFIDALQPHFNQTNEEFIKNLTELPDAARYIDFQEGVYEEDEKNLYPNQEADHFEYCNPDKDIKITVDKETREYVFHDPVSNKYWSMNDLANFIKKYYDDEGSLYPLEEYRENAFVDWPMPAPPSEPAPTDPPADVGEDDEGYWYWQEGTSGTPPGPSKYTRKEGSEMNIVPPTSPVVGYISFDPTDKDGGKDEWSTPGTPGEDGEDDSYKKTDEENNNDSKIKICNCNGGDCVVCSGGSGGGEGNKITIESKILEPGSPGTLPGAGKYVWHPVIKTNTEGKDGEDGKEGEAEGKSTLDEDNSEGEPGSEGTNGTETTTPGTSNPGYTQPTTPSTPSNPSTPSRSFRSGRYGC